MGASRDLAFEGTTLRVDSDDASALAWLEEFLCPWFERILTGDHPQLRVQHHPVPWEGELPALHGTASLLRLDSQVVALPAIVEGAVTVLFDRQRRERYQVDPIQATVTVECQLRLGFMRVVRDIAVAAYRRDHDAVELHAAAFSLGGRAVAIAGGKGAGKTTTLMHVITHLGASLISNDRLLVERRGSEHQGLGVPSVVSVRGPTSKAFPSLAASTPGVEHTSQLTLAENDRQLALLGPAPMGSRLRLSPAQVLRTLGATAVRASPLRAIVFPEFAQSESLLPLSHQEILPLLSASLFGSTRKGPTLLEELVCGAPGAKGDVPHRDPARALVRLADEVACLRLQLIDGQPPSRPLIDRIGRL